MQNKNSYNEEKKAFAKELAARLRIIRLNLDLTQETFAAPANLDQKAYSYYEMGKGVLDLFQIYKIFKYHGILNELDLLLREYK